MVPNPSKAQAMHPTPLHAPHPTLRLPTLRLAPFAVQDWLVALYLLVLLGSVLAGHGPRRPMALGCLAADGGAFLVAMAIARSKVERFRFVADVLYRGALVGALVATFLQLQYILPSASDRLVDASLHRLDLALFGFEPAALLDRFVTPARTEWFSFFYYSYFFLLLAYFVPAALF